MTTVKKWVNGAKVLEEEPETSVATLSDLWDTISRIERKIDKIAQRSGAFTTLEGVSQAEKNSLKGGGE